MAGVPGLCRVLAMAAEAGRRGVVECYTRSLVPGLEPHRPGTHLYMLGEVQAARDLEQDT